MAVAEKRGMLSRLLVSGVFGGLLVFFLEDASTGIVMRLNDWTSDWEFAPLTFWRYSAYLWFVAYLALAHVHGDFGNTEAKWADLITDCFHVVAAFAAIVALGFVETVPHLDSFASAPWRPTIVFLAVTVIALTSLLRHWKDRDNRNLTSLRIVGIVFSLIGACSSFLQEGPIGCWGIVASGVLFLALCWYAILVLR